MEIIGKLNFDEKGLIPAIIQDAKSLRVLTLCYMTKEALEDASGRQDIRVPPLQGKAYA
jgi:phosphoribosyl-AMP cyclohydrolase